MQLFHHYHHHFSLNKLLHSEFWLFESSVWLHVFGRSLIVVFIPIILFAASFSIGEVMLYYFIYSLFDIPLNFFARWLVRKIGARLVIIAGILSSIGFFVVLFNLTPNNWSLLILLALFAALYDVLYWVAHIYIFIESSRKRHSASKDTSIFYIVKMVAGMLAPAIGAAILIFFNHQVLIVFSVIFLGLSIWPLIKMKKTKDKPTEKQPTFREFISIKNDFKDYLVTSFYGLHVAAEGVIWPIFIFVIFETFESVAAVPIIISLTTIIFTYFIGNIRRQNRSNMLIVGSLLVAMVWILRIFVDSPIFYFVSVFLIGMFSVLITIPLDSNIFEQGQKKNALTVSTYRNIFAMMLRTLLYGSLALLVNIFNVSFVIAATGMFVVIAITLLFKGGTNQNLTPKELGQV